MNELFFQKTEHFSHWISNYSLRNHASYNLCVVLSFLSALSCSIGWHSERLLRLIPCYVCVIVDDDLQAIHLHFSWNIEAMTKSVEDAMHIAVVGEIIYSFSHPFVASNSQ